MARRLKRNVAVLVWLAVAAAVWVADRPNIVWIVTEDNAPHRLRLYNPEGGAPMPNIERLAKEGIVFEHAFSNAPVCSVARTTLITGCYAPRILGQYHRRTEFAPMPGDLEMFPHYLRQAGYYTTNNHKTDYNVEGVWPWDESSPEASYRNRAEGQPFFHVQNYTTTHEGRLHFSQEEMEEHGTLTDPAGLEPLPYHPNTETFRYTQARLLDQHRKADEQMGEFLALIGQGDPETVLERALAESDQETEALLILNTMALLKDLRLGYAFDVDSLAASCRLDRREKVRGVAPAEVPWG